MRLPFLRFMLGCLLATTSLLGFGLKSWGAPGEESLLMLHNGGCACGIMTQIGGRIVVFRTEAGDNVLDARPELWKNSPPLDLLSTKFKQYYGESVWAGPQADWWTEREPYPPEAKNSWHWPPDPAWETAPFTIVEQSPTRVILRGPISKLTGLELTKTIELQPDGQLHLQEQAVNRGDRVTTRDLWLLHRVPPAARNFLSLKAIQPDKGFTAATQLQTINGLTILELAPVNPGAKPAAGKMRAEATEGWMATIVPGAFFIVKFHAANPSKTAPGQAPVEIYCSQSPHSLCEMEHHTEIKTLHPGDTMESDETWQIVPYDGAPTVYAQARFLQAKELSAASPHVD